MTRQGRTATLFVVAAVAVAVGGFAVGKATGSDDPGTGEAQALEPVSSSQARPELAATPPVPALRASRQESSGGSGSTQAEVPQSQVTAPQAEAPQAQTQTPQAPAPAPAPQQQPAAPQPETPVPGE